MMRVTGSPSILVLRSQERRESRPPGAFICPDQHTFIISDPAFSPVALRMELDETIRTGFLRNAVALSSIERIPVAQARAAWRVMAMQNQPQADHQRRLTEKEEEARSIRRLQVMIGMVMSVIGQYPNLTLEEASELTAGARRAALAMFPDKELAYDLIYKPRLQRLMNERFRLQ